MKCEEVLEMMAEYADNLLPESMRVRVEEHLVACDACRTECELWTKSGLWLQMDKEQYNSVHAPRSIVDAVMTRIFAEDRWAIPIRQKVFTVTARMWRFAVSTALVLLILCGLSLYTISQEGLIGDNHLFTPTKPEAIAASIETTPGIAQIHANSGFPAAGEVASSVFVYETGVSLAEKPDFVIIVSLFGILTAVITMSWLSRAQWHR